MTEQEVVRIFEVEKALLRGHFKLSSGLHSEQYLQCALVLQHPAVAEKLSRQLADKLKGMDIDVVVGPALGGVTLAYEVARALGVRGIFTERQEGTMVLRRGFAIKSGERVLVAEDVVTTGGSTREVIEVVRKSGGTAVAVCSVIDRSDPSIDFGLPFISLAKVRVKTYAESDCPLCKAKVPVEKPGSRK